AVDEAAAREHIHRRGHLGDQRGRAIRVAGDEDADADPPRFACERREQRPGFHLRLTGRTDDWIEVVVEPDGVEAQGVRLVPVGGEGLVADAFLRCLDAEMDGGGDHTRRKRIASGTTGPPALGLTPARGSPALKGKSRVMHLPRWSIPNSNGWWPRRSTTSRKSSPATWRTSP